MLINTVHNETYSTQNTPRRVVATPSFWNSVDKPSTHGAFSFMAYVYRHVRLDRNEPFYIGIGQKDDHKRAYNSTNRNAFWKNIVSKTEYVVEILIDGISYADARKKEIEFIKLYGRKDLNTGTLVNLTDGGEGALNRIIPTTHREIISKRHSGKITPESTKAKMRERALGRKPSLDTIKKLKESHKGITQSNECRMKKSLATKGTRLGNKNPAFKGEIEVIKDGEVVGMFQGVTACNKAIGIPATTISWAIKNNRVVNGYSFSRFAIIHKDKSGDFEVENKRIFKDKVR